MAASMGWAIDPSRGRLGPEPPAQSLTSATSSLTGLHPNHAGWPQPLPVHGCPPHMEPCSRNVLGLGRALWGVAARDVAWGLLRGLPKE